LSKPKEPLPAKLVIALIYKKKTTAQSGWEAMEEAWGRIDFLSRERLFDYTDYYEEEMGRPLYRRWAAFQELISQERLPEIKWQALGLEDRWRIDQKRPMNIDPGLITSERLVLATGKNYSHRLYLGKGIFGDLTLVFHKGSFQPLPWTYPDYRDDQVIWMFNKIREKYHKDLAELKKREDRGQSIS
jgi:Domain of unknown function (DUF4416)